MKIARSYYENIPLAINPNVNYLSQSCQPTSLSIVNRNFLSIPNQTWESKKEGIKELKTLSDANKEKNNYLNPFSTFEDRLSKQSDLRNNVPNFSSYNIEREKLFAK